MVGEDLGDGHFVEAEADFGLFAEEAEAGHGGLDGVDVDAPQVDEEDDLELELGVFGHGDVAALVGGVLVVEEEGVAEEEDLAEPFEDVGVVGDLVLDELLADREEDLGKWKEFESGLHTGFDLLGMTLRVEYEKSQKVCFGQKELTRIIFCKFLLPCTFPLN